MEKSLSSLETTTTENVAEDYVQLSLNAPNAETHSKKIALHRAK
jgi:hypothetical protein